MIPGAPMPGGSPGGAPPSFGGLPHPMQPSPQMPPPGPPQAPQQAPAPAPPGPMVFDGQKFLAAVQMLRDERTRGFRVDIEVESTIAADQEAQQAARTTMLQAVGAFLQSAFPMMQAVPSSLPMIGKMLLFLVRSFNAGVELESAFEDAIEKLEANPGAAMQNPNAGQAQAEQTKIQGQMALQAQDIQQDQEKHQFDMQAKAADLQADQIKAAAEERKALIAEQTALAAHHRSLEQARVQAAVQPAAAPMAPQKLMFGQGPAMTGTHK